MQGEMQIVPIQQEENKLQAVKQNELNTQMWALFTEKASLFTKGETSSLAEEIAEDLMRSIQFTVLQAVPKQYTTQEAQWQFLQEVLLIKPLSTMYEQGKAHIQAEVQKGKALLHMAEKKMPVFASVPCVETMQGIHTFFKAYDIDFFAHRIPCDIDYQLAIPVPLHMESGVVFINQYLKQLLAEFSFCNAVYGANAEVLLQEHTTNYRHEILNICEPLFINAVGCALAGANIQALQLNMQEMVLLDDLLLGAYSGGADEKLRNACKTVQKELGLKGAFEQAYFLQMTENIINRVKLLGGQSKTENIFLMFS